MKKMRKHIAVLLAVCMLGFCFITPAAAVTDYSSTGYSSSEKVGHTFYQFVDKLITLLGKVINMFMPGFNWTGKIPTVNTYTPPAGYKGERVFDTDVHEESHWSMGFADASLLAGLDVTAGDYYMAGTMEAMEGRTPTAVVDDQTVNVYAVSDGVSGTVVHVVLDGYGIARGDVITIRDRLADFAAQNDIISLNVSVLHQHSCIDTLGLSAPLLPALVKNPGAVLFTGADSTALSGKNETFMNNLFNVVERTVEEAVSKMMGGSIYYGSVDISEYIHDKREPIVFDGNIHRLRFVPDNESAPEIWVCEAGMHCVSFGAGPDVVTSDFPYYLKQYIKNKVGADVVFIEGAELAITADYSKVNYDDSEAANKLIAMGKAIGDRLLSIEKEELLPPVLNVKHQEMFIDADNEILILAMREGLVNSIAVKDGLGYKVATEIGYMEFGNKVGVLLAPGEVAPEILWGGATSSDASWNGESWDYPALADVCGADTLICFGLCNDQIGYVICDNDVRSYLTENEEIVAASTTSASTLVESFIQLINSVK